MCFIDVYKRQAHAGQSAVGIAAKGCITIPPDGHKVKPAAMQHRFQQAFTANQCVLHLSLIHI